MFRSVSFYIILIYVYIFVISVKEEIKSIYTPPDTYSGLFPSLFIKQEGTCSIHLYTTGYVDKSHVLVKVLTYFIVKQTFYNDNTSVTRNILLKIYIEVKESIFVISTCNLRNKKKENK